MPDDTDIMQQFDRAMDELEHIWMQMTPEQQDAVTQVIVARLRRENQADQC